MKLWKLTASLFVFASCVLLNTSCSDDSSDGPHDDPAPVLPEACITDSIRYDDKKATVYNIEYPSVDPYGQPVTLSGAIVLGDETRTDNHFAGTVLYNHFTVYHRDQCPTHGDLGIPLMVVGTKMVAVLPDYYGFGVTEDKNQAYCISECNGQGSVDCLIAARKLLKAKGFTWDDLLLNIGYSEGAQTAIGALRYSVQHHPEIKFTHTIAGGGPYDICETYRQLILSKRTTMPSTVISSLLAYNEFRMLGYEYSDLFLEPTRSKIDKYLLSKNYKQEDVEANLATETIEDWIEPQLLDFNTPISRRFMETFGEDNLTEGWIPAPDWRITLIHNNLDGAVHVANSHQLVDFFKQNGYLITEDHNESFTDGTVYVHYFDIPRLNIGGMELGAHELGALTFVVDLGGVLTHYLGKPFILNLTIDDLKNIYKR